MAQHFHLGLFTPLEFMRHLYSLLLYLLTPALMIYFLVRGLSDRAWLRRWPERFGDFDTTGKMHGIVVHAVSVGEVNAAAPLIKALLRRWPELPVTVTCFTPTGSARIQALFGDSVHHVYAPIDLPGSVWRFLKSLEPRLLLVMETEIWPNLFSRAGRMGIPTLISNARLTERSADSWSRFHGLVSQTLGHATLIAAQTEEDARRYVTLGANRDRTRTIGNLKFDLELPSNVPQLAGLFRQQWGKGRKVLVAGSTHEDDETPLLDALERIWDESEETLLVLAPRYPERFDRVAETAASRGIKTQKLSDGAGLGAAVQCLVIDRMGELLGLYAACDIAFVGGTLADVGGHNPLEAAALGRPLLIGPHTAHIESVASLLVDAGAATRVDGAEHLYQAWMSLNSDAALGDRMGTAARKLVEREQGALDRTLQIIEAILLQ